MLYVISQILTPETIITECLCWGGGEGALLQSGCLLGHLRHAVEPSLFGQVSGH